MYMWLNGTNNCRVIFCTHLVWWRFLRSRGGICTSTSPTSSRTSLSLRLCLPNTFEVILIWRWVFWNWKNWVCILSVILFRLVIKKCFPTTVGFVKADRPQNLIYSATFVWSVKISFFLSLNWLYFGISTKNW